MNSLLPNATTAPTVASTSQTPVAAPGSSADPTTVTPVTPASAQVAPAVALDKVAVEPTVLQKALGMAQPYLAKVDAVTHPYVEKVQQTTKPYTDAALNKAKELIDKVEGPGPTYPGTPVHAAMYGGDGATSIGATSAESRSQPADAVPGDSAPGSTSAASSTTAVGSTNTQTLEERIDGVFASLSRRASVVATKIDEKTATPNKPGWATQVASAVQKVTDKADAFIQGHAPTATNATSTIGHPVTTTTNSVPHTDKPAVETVPPAAFAAGPTASSTSAGPPVPAAQAPVAPIAPTI